MTDIHALLAGLPLFASLAADDIRQLADSLRPIEAAEGATLFRENEYGDHFYIVTEGEIEVVKAAGTADERLIAVRGRGEFVGEMGLINRDSLRTATVRTRSPARLLEMSRADFDALLLRQPMLAYEMVRVMSTRLNAAHNAAVRDLVEKNRQLSEAYDALKAAQAQIIEKERLERELKVAADIQMSLLPTELPKIEGFSLGARLVPARVVGGDLYDFIRLDSNTLGVVIGDVTDKGVPAAIFMAQTHALLHAEATRAASPRDALLRVNELLLTMNARGLFATVIYGVLDRASRVFHYARAGHEVPLVRDGNGHILPPLPERPGVPLGLFDRPPLDEQTITIPTGGTLLLFTDGATDTRNTVGRSFENAGLQSALAACGHLDAQHLCDELLIQISAFQGDAPQMDDVALIAVQAC